MRKQIIADTSSQIAGTQNRWLDVASLAAVQVSSEAPEHPVEEALEPEGGSGWRAAAPGPQTLRLVFDEPQSLRRIRVRFEERESERRQEFVLRWSADGATFREIVRQQWNFSPSGATSEVEEYAVELSGVAVLELRIIPDMSGGDAHASLAELRIAD